MYLALEGWQVSNKASLRDSTCICISLLPGPLLLFVTRDAQQDGAAGAEMDVEIARPAGCGAQPRIHSTEGGRAVVIWAIAKATTSIYQVDAGRIVESARWMSQVSCCVRKNPLTGAHHSPERPDCCARVFAY